MQQRKSKMVGASRRVSFLSYRPSEHQHSSSSALLVQYSCPQKRYRVLPLESHTSDGHSSFRWKLIYFSVSAGRHELVALLLSFLSHNNNAELQSTGLCFELGKNRRLAKKCLASSPQQRIRVTLRKVPDCLHCRETY